MSFVPEQLMAQAVEASGGLDDFGDGAFRAGLDALCSSINTDAQLSDLGTMALQANIAGSLTNRLRLVDYSSRHAAELANEKVVAPIIVVGLFRAGTTFLSYLFDQDPANRALLRWETSDTVPPPTPDTFRTGPRVEAARASAEMMDLINPNFKAIHHEEADGPTECISLMSQDFVSLMWESVANVPGYSEWLFANDHHSAYRYHHQALRVLQSGGVRGRWTLKSPHHALAPDAIVAEYPDAKLVMLHRDPLVLSASVCSLITSLSGTFTNADHRAYIASHWTQVLTACIDRVNAFRDAHPEHQIIDVQYADLVRDPVNTLSGIYDAAGSALSAEARANVSEYVTSHRKGRFGTHKYHLDEFGLDAAMLENHYADYIERYAVERERAIS